MNVEIATKEIIPELLELAREMEPLFEAPMADNPEFKAHIEDKIEKNEVLIVRDKEHYNALMGGIVISHSNSEILWFAVFNKYRRKGAGEKLLDYAINELGRDKVIEVTTFQENNLEGIPARRLYEKFGFAECSTVTVYGFSRSLMKRLPK